jgi:hypothetical protein
MKRKRTLRKSDSSSSPKRSRGHAKRKTKQVRRRLQSPRDPNVSRRQRRGPNRVQSAKARREFQRRQSRKKNLPKTIRSLRRRIETDQRSRSASRKGPKGTKGQRKEKKAQRDYLVTVEFYARPAGGGKLKKYTKSIVVPAPAISERGRLSENLRNYILTKALRVMPRVVDRLITDQEWMNAEIHRGPYTTRKRARSRR